MWVSYYSPSVQFLLQSWVHVLVAACPALSFSSDLSLSSFLLAVSVNVGMSRWSLLIFRQFYSASSSRECAETVISLMRQFSNPYICVFPTGKSPFYFIFVSFHFGPRSTGKIFGHHPQTPFTDGKRITMTFHPVPLTNRFMFRYPSMIDPLI
jgi:hypothetical protein